MLWEDIKNGTNDQARRGHVVIWTAGDSDAMRCRPDVVSSLLNPDLSVSGGLFVFFGPRRRRRAGPGVMRGPALLRARLTGDASGGTPPLA